MTRKIKKNPDDIDKALHLLYGNGIRDLTFKGYQKALGTLRKTDPTTARRVERTLQPYLEERIFPRKQRAWYNTSEGTRARLALLPQNPHLQADVLTIRAVLGIPDVHLRATEGDAIWKEMEECVRPEAVRQAVEGNLVSSWLHIHGQTAMKVSQPDKDDFTLTSELRQSAVSAANVNLGEDSVPEWLRHPPFGPAPYDKSVIPIEWVSGRLVERHCIPGRAASPLAFYILTQDPAWITGLELMQVEITNNDQKTDDPASFNVLVRGIDEFITKEDWDHIWKRYVNPRQKQLWKQRGTSPQGRRSIEIDRLQYWMPLYCKKINEKLSMSELLSIVYAGGLENEDTDEETIRIVINDLDELLSPRT